MKIFIGADHRGFYLKAKIIKALAAKGFEMIDVGTHCPQTPCDYPKFSCKVGKGVVGSPGARGILVCMSGIGHSIAANRIKGVRAALCYNVKAAKLSRAHNDANVLVLGAKFVSAKDIDRIIRVWLATSFEGGRHLRRIKQIDRLTCAKRA